MVSLNFLKRSLVFPILLFPSVSLHHSHQPFMLFSGTLPSERYIYPFLLCLLLLFFKYRLDLGLFFPRTWTRSLSLRLTLGINSISWVFARSCWLYTAQPPWGCRTVCCALDIWNAQSLQILAFTALWSIRISRPALGVENSDSFLIESTILFLQTVHWLHDRMDWPGLSCCWILVTSDTVVKKHQSLTSVSEGFVLSEYTFFLLWPTASYTFSLWSSKRETQTPFAVINTVLSGTSFLTRLSPPVQ